MTSVQTSKEKLQGLLNQQGGDGLPPAPDINETEKAPAASPAIPAFAATRSSQRKEPVLGLENQVEALKLGDIRYCVGPGYTTQGELVLHVQKLLNRVLPLEPIKETGSFNEETRERVFAFQIADSKAGGMCQLDEPDGIVGPNTMHALEFEDIIHRLSALTAPKPDDQQAFVPKIEISVQKTTAAGWAIAEATKGSRNDIAAIVSALLSLNYDEIQSLKWRWAEGEFQQRSGIGRQSRSLEKVLKRELKGDLEDSVLNLLASSTSVEVQLDRYKSEVGMELRWLACRSKLGWKDVVRALEPGGQLEIQDRVEHAREIKAQRSSHEFMRYIQTIREAGILDEFIEAYGSRNFARDTAGTQPQALREGLSQTTEPGNAGPKPLNLKKVSD